MTKKILFVMAMSAAAFGCKKKDGEADKAGGGDSPKVAASDLPALTADPDPGAITATEKAPLDAVKFRMLAKRDNTGWPKFDAYNLGTKPIGYMAIYAYAYDKDGKQLAKTKVPLSWNGEIAPGDKSMFSISVGSMDDAPPAGATTFQLCYKSASFKGEKDTVDDPARCPDQRPKS
ncbi:MAG: hypothetical protein ABI867_00410 [Kofleriaceae bacterium]